MKKFLSVVAFVLAAVFVSSSLWLKTGAKRAHLNQDDLERIKQISLEHLQSRKAQRGLVGSSDASFVKTDVDELGMAHTRFRQTINNVPVWGGEAIVHLKSDDSLSSISDDMKSVVAIGTDPNFSDKEAIGMGLKLYGNRSKALTAPPTADLWIFPAADGTSHLAYRVQLRREDGSKDTAMPVYFIDAHTGEKLFYYNNLQTGTGSSLYSGNVTIGTSSANGTYYMENLTRKVGTFNYNNGTSTAARFTDADDVWTASNARAGVDAQFGAEATMNYYQNVHNRNGIDGSGGPGYTTAAANSSISLITSRVHYSSGYNNAFWNGSYMTYGDGDGTTFTPLVTLDICGHEMTHGVTERTAGLAYSNESGALNESMSDVMGTMVERYARPSNWNWLIGEDAYTPGTPGDALRRMDNPNAVGDPDHYSLRYTGTQDNGGVHTNSSIANHTFYLIAAGGTNRVSGVAVAGIGPDDAAKIWYRALTVYMTSSTNFAGARTATISAANDLFGSTSTQSNSVATGWCAVGVGACPGGGTPTPTPTPGGGGNELIVNGGFEGSASPWVNSGSGAFYTNSGSYPRGGTGYDYFGVNNSVTGQTYQQVSIPSGAPANLTFWLNVSSSESAATPYDYLYAEVRDASGNLLTTLATYSNQNKTTAGSYSQKSFSLAAYRGQTVRIQFRTTTDSSVTTTFRVDDVSLK